MNTAEKRINEIVTAVNSRRYPKCAVTNIKIVGDKINIYGFFKYDSPMYTGAVLFSICVSSNATSSVLEVQYTGSVTPRKERAAVTISRDYTRRHRAIDPELAVEHLLNRIADAMEEAVVLLDGMS